MAKGIRLNWTLSADDATDVDVYSIKRSNAPGATAEYATVPAGTATYEDRGPGGNGLGDGVYYYRLTARDSEGNESAYTAELSQIVDSTAPAVPTGFSIEVFDFTP